MLRLARAVTVVLGLTAFACNEPPAPTPEDPVAPPYPVAPPSATARALPSATARAEPKVYEHEVLSEVYEVDRIYKSMQGPSGLQQVALGAEGERELLWIVGFEAVMVDPEGGEKISQEFMCHTNLDIDVAKHQATFDDDKPFSGRLFTLSQGQYRIDLPPGFGIPIVSDELLDVNTQVLNLNLPNVKRSVRHRVIMRFMRDRDLAKPMKALFVSGAYGLKLLEGKDGHYGLAEPSSSTGHEGHEGHEGHGEPGAHGGACLPGENAGKHSLDDGKGRVFTGHWVVKPGREVNHTRVTELMDLPFDTRVHYVAVHLHPFAESLELIDLTTKKSVYRAKTRQADRGIGLAHVDFYSSDEGLPVFRDHEYEIVSTYNNTSNQDQDSMAVLNLYMLDEKFQKPDLAKPVPPPAGSGSSQPAASAKPTGKMM